MSQELTDNLPGIWGLGELVYRCAIYISPLWGFLGRARCPITAGGETPPLRFRFIFCTFFLREPLSFRCLYDFVGSVSGMGIAVDKGSNIMTTVEPARAFLNDSAHRLARIDRRAHCLSVRPTRLTHPVESLKNDLLSNRVPPLRVPHRSCVRGPPVRQTTDQFRQLRRWLQRRLPPPYLRSSRRGSVFALA